MQKARTLDWATLRRVAVIATADPRTVAAVMRGDAVRAGVRQRIERALDAEGIERARAGITQDAFSQEKA